MTFQEKKSHAHIAIKIINKKKNTFIVEQIVNLLED